MFMQVVARTTNLGDYLSIKQASRQQAATSTNNFCSHAHMLFYEAEYGRIEVLKDTLNIFLASKFHFSKHTSLQH